MKPPSSQTSAVWRPGGRQLPITVPYLREQADLVIVGTIVEIYLDKDRERHCLLN